MLNKNKTLAIIALSVLSACAVRSITPGDTMEVNMDFDITAMDMRHGWALLTPPKLTYIGTNDKDSIKRGKSLYTKNCQKCHGKTGVGDGPTAKKLNIKPANLQNITNDVTNTYLVVQINNGKGDMPRWQDFLTTEQSYDLTNYIRTLKKAYGKKKK